MTPPGPVAATHRNPNHSTENQTASARLAAPCCGRAVAAVGRHCPSGGDRFGAVSRSQKGRLLQHESLPPRFVPGFQAVDVVWPRRTHPMVAPYGLETRVCYRTRLGISANPG